MIFQVYLYGDAEKKSSAGIGSSNLPACVGDGWMDSFSSNPFCVSFHTCQQCLSCLGHVTVTWQQREKKIPCIASERGNNIYIYFFTMLLF